MTVPTVESAPRLYARIGGALYLMLIVAGVVGGAIRSSIIVSGDAAATAAGITSKETLWRFGIAFEILALLSAVALAMIYFVLLRPVSKELNLLATFLRLVATTVQTVSALNLVEALSPLGNAAFLKAFTPGQLDALASLAIRSRGQGVGLALLLFGACFLVHGYLIFRSGFLPRVLGILIQVAGVCYMTNSFATLLAPTFTNRIPPVILLPCFVAEGSLCLWLLLKGVDVAKWKEKAAAAKVDGS